MACNHDYPPNGNCDLAYLDGTTLLGVVRYCNAIVNQQLTIQAKTTIAVLDSLLIFNVVDTDSLYDYEFIDTTEIKCVYWEGNENYELYEFPNSNQIRIGVLTTQGNTLHLDIKKDPCPESTAFIGFRK